MSKLKTFRFYKFFFLILIIISFLFLFSPIFSSKTLATTCQTDPSLCQPGFVCLNKGSGYHCYATINCTGTGGICQNTACLNGSHSGGCSSGLHCCNPGGTQCTSPNSCTSASACSSSGGTSLGTMNCGSNICCAPPGGGGGGGGGGTPPPTLIQS